MRQQLKRRALRKLIRYGVRPFLGGRLPYRMQRATALAATNLCLSPAGMQYQQIKLGGVTGEEVSASDTTNGTLLWFHGGGYCVGSSRTDRAPAGQFSKASGTRVILPDYRLAPEDPHPAALEDALSVYQALINQQYDLDKLIIGGDSAGGGLALALAIALRDRGLPLPTAMVLFSPWVDLRNVLDSHHTRASADPWLTTKMLNNWAAAYCDDKPVDLPTCSPLLAGLHGLPPTLIQVGDCEILLDDSVELDKKLRASGVDSELQIFPDMWHVFFLQAGLLSQADDAIEAMGLFIRQRIDAANCDGND